MVLLLASAGSLSAQYTVNTEQVVIRQSDEAWRQAPNDFRGVAFGSNEQSLISVLGAMKCRAHPAAHDLPARRECKPRSLRQAMKVAGIEIVETYVFDQDGKFSQVRLGSGGYPMSYADVVSAFTERYGPSTTVLREQVAGTEIYSEINVWESDAMRIRVASQGDAQTFGFGAVETQEWRRRVDEHVDSARRRTTSKF